MLSVSEIRDVKFSRAVGGYKAEDVDILLDKIEADYAAFERIIKDYELKVEIQVLQQRHIPATEGFKNSQNSIQNVLVSAQSLADKIVSEAKEKSEEIIKQAQMNIESITVREKELSAAFELKAQEQKSGLEKELKSMVEEAQKKSDAIVSATEERVKHQQMLFDKLKLEIASLKSSVTAKYKEHIELLSKIPDSVPDSPEYVAEVLSASYDKIQASANTKTQDKETAEISSNSGGFVIGEDLEEEE